VAGGVGDAIENSTELYDQATGIWSLSGDLANGRYFHSAMLLSNGMVLVAGGYLGLYEELETTSTEIYNANTGTWSDGGAMALARASQTATLLPDGSVLIAGGFNEFSATQETEIGTRTNPAPER
jgi:hypothetical protein